MKHDKLFDFYERLYFFEIENKDKIHTRIQAVFGLVVLSVSVQTYLAKNISFDKVSLIPIAAAVLVIVSFLITFYSCLTLKKAFWGNEFRYIPTPDEIKVYYGELVDYEKAYITYCAENKIPYNSEHNSSEKLSSYIIDELVECTSWNARKNEDRSSEIYKSIKIFFISLVPLLLSVVIFMVSDLDSASPRNAKIPSYIIIPLDNIRKM